MVTGNGYSFHFIWIIVIFFGLLFLINIWAYWTSKRPRKFGNEESSISLLPNYGFSSSLKQENRQFYFSIVHSDGGSEYAVPVNELPTVLNIFDDFIIFGQNYTGPFKSRVWTQLHQQRIANR